jgi:hypothetical protein
MNIIIREKFYDVVSENLIMMNFHEKQAFGKVYHFQRRYRILLYVLGMGISLVKLERMLSGIPLVLIRSL